MIRTLLIAALCACPLLAFAGPPRSLRAREATEVAYTGAFTPDGRLFVYFKLPNERTNKCELCAMNTISGRSRTLGRVAMIKPQPAASRSRGVWSLVVVGATIRAQSVFVRQAGGVAHSSRLRLWRRGKPLLALPFIQTASVAPAPKAQRAAIADPTLAKEDAALINTRNGQVTSRWTLAPRGRGTDLQWYGDTLYALAQRYDPGGRISIWGLHQLSPRPRKLGDVAQRQAVRPGGTMGAILPPLLHGATLEKPSELVLTQGRTLLRATRDQDKIATVGQLLYDESDVNQQMLLTFDPVQGTIWTIEVRELDKKAYAHRKLGYIPYATVRNALGEKLLQVRGFALDVPTAPRRSIEVGLTSAFRPLYDRAVEATKEVGLVRGPKQGKVRLDERVELLGAHGARLLLRLELCARFVSFGMCYERLAVYDPITPQLFVEAGATMHRIPQSNRAPSAGLPRVLFSRDRAYVARIQDGKLQLVSLEKPGK